MAEAHKQLNAAIAVLKAYHTHGARSSLFSSEWDEQARFCSMSPPVPFPLPIWLRQERHRSGISAWAPWNFGSMWNRVR